MKRISRFLAIGGMMAAATLASAQNSNSGYFVDGYTYRYQLNPAFAGMHGFVAIPGIGNLNVGLRGNLGLSDVLYKVNGRTALFTNPNVGVSEFLDNVKDRSKFMVNTRVNILGIGFRGLGGYNAITLGVRAQGGVAIPKSFFELAKEGISNKTYTIKDLQAHSNAYAEIALNHSRFIDALPGLRVGAAVKFLIGAGNVDAYFNEADLTLGTDSWTARTNADVYASVPKMQFEEKLNNKNQKYVSGVNFDGTDGIKPQGYGAAFDLGASYHWNDFDFSAAVLDLGFINFSNVKYATTDGTKVVDTDSFIFSPNDDAPNSFDKEMDRLTDDLEGLYQLENKGDAGSRTVSLGATLNVGAQYTLPVYKAVKFGLLYTGHFHGDMSYNEARLSANYAPCKIFAIGINGWAGTFGTGYGWIISLHPKGFNLFLSSDAAITKLAKQGVPLNSNAQFNFGITFPF